MFLTLTNIQQGSPLLLPQPGMQKFCCIMEEETIFQKGQQIKQMCNLSFCITLTHIIEHFKVCKIKEETKSWDGWTDAQHNRSLGFFIIFTSCVNFVWAHKL